MPGCSVAVVAMWLGGFCGGGRCGIYIVTCLICPVEYIRSNGVDII